MWGGGGKEVVVRWWVGMVEEGKGEGVESEVVWCGGVVRGEVASGGSEGCGDAS